MKKVYVLTVSKVFPKTHERAGQLTGFVDEIKRLPNSSRKIHTIRGNFALWSARADKINKGEALLSIRYWSGKPYNSPQIEIMQLHSIGVEKLHNPKNPLSAPIGNVEVNWHEVAKNDGLTSADFCEWFKKCTDEPMVVIHFTDFRYSI